MPWAGPYWERTCSGATLRYDATGRRVYRGGGTVAAERRRRRCRRRPPVHRRQCHPARIDQPGRRRPARQPHGGQDAHTQRGVQQGVGRESDAARRGQLRHQLRLGDAASFTLSPITARAFNGVQQSIDNETVITNDINGTTVPTRTATLNGALTFANAAAFNALFTPSIPLGDNFTTVFETTLTVITPGVYTFAVTNNDDGAAAWLKPAANASFAAGDGCKASSATTTRPWRHGTWRPARTRWSTRSGKARAARP